MAGLFQRAFSMDPGAYQRGVESQLRLEALQRAETQRQLQQQYGPGNLDLPDLGQISQSRPQIQVPVEQPKPVAPAAPKPQADVQAGTPQPVAPKPGTAAADAAKFAAPKEPSADLDFYFTNQFPDLFETPADPNDPESFATGGFDTSALYNARQLEAEARQLAGMGAYDRADAKMAEAKRLRQGKGFSPAERIEKLITEAEDSGWAFGLGATNPENAKRYIAQAREMYNTLIQFGTPEALEQARQVATKYRRQLGINEADIPAAPAAPAAPGQQMVAPNQNATVENIRPQAAPTPPAPAAPATVQRSNTGDTVAANVPPGITQAGTPAPVAGVKTPASPSVIDQAVTKGAGATITPASNFYMAQPSAIGFDLQRGTRQRQELAQLARIARASGDMGQFYKIYEQLQTADENLYYLNGMQGLADLDVGATGRAEAILRRYSGVPYEITARSDGQFQIGLNGQTKTMTQSDLTNWLRNFFDANFRKSQAERANKRKDTAFETYQDIIKKNAELAGQMVLETVKGDQALSLQDLKNKGITDPKVTPDGAVIFSYGGRVYKSSRRKLVVDGEEIIKDVTEEIFTPDNASAYTEEQYRSSGKVK